MHTAPGFFQSRRYKQRARQARPLCRRVSAQGEGMNARLFVNVLRRREAAPPSSRSCSTPSTAAIRPVARGEAVRNERQRHATRRVLRSLALSAALIAAGLVVSSTTPTNPRFPMFELHEAAAKITSFTVFPENHGATEKDTGNTIGCGSPSPATSSTASTRNCGRRSSGRWKAGEQQDMHRDNDGLVALLFPRVGALDWDEEFPGYEASIHANSFVPRAHRAGRRDAEGPVVPRARRRVHRRAVPAEVPPGTEQETGHLSKLLKREAVLTLTPPTKQTTE